VSFLAVYLDSSALLKLVLPERETEALRTALARWPDWITSRLTAIECRRAVRRAGDHPSVRTRVDGVLAACTLLHLDDRMLRLAEVVGTVDWR
jgi:hypothetical protein